MANKILVRGRDCDLCGAELAETREVAGSARGVLTLFLCDEDMSVMKMFVVTMRGVRREANKKLAEQNLGGENHGSLGVG